MPTHAPAVDPPADVFDAQRLASIDPLETEWVLTNALGGFAMGTVLGVATRRYHGCLVAAMAPPVKRVLTLGAVDECLTLRAPGHAPALHRLTLFHFAGEPDRPDRDRRLVRFERADGCRWVYELAGPHATVRVERRLRLVDAHNAAVLEYKIDAPGLDWTLELRPLTPLRDVHALGDRGDRPRLHRSWTDDRGRPWAIVATDAAGLTIGCSRGRFEPTAQTWAGRHYLWEARRGQDAVEDAHAPGVFVVDAGPDPVTLTASVEGSDAFDTDARPRRRLAMARAALERAPHADDRQRRALTRLAFAADDFVVRSTHAGVEGRSIIAGYPWFSDWGRDSMIALPGLLLATGRHPEAFGVLRTFADARRNGLIPNRFDDQEGAAHYNTADASLWFLHAACDYYHVTRDRAGFFDALAPACADVVQAYKHGTDYAIGADPADGLVRAGDPSTQLTWMDAQRDGVTFTPRHGKPVEINALWHHGLASLAHAFDGALDAQAAELHTMSARVARSFARAFSGGPAGGLVDCLFPAPGGQWTRSTELRPNQVFAASLARAPLDAPARRAVLAVVREHLLTPVGLRTLAPTDPAYRPRFEGPLFERDAAYHNGTVWPWLLGPYAEGLLRAGSFSPDARREALAVLATLLDELDGRSVGQLWEVYDADEPRRPDGCIAQAWSVAEPLRVMVKALSDRR